MIRLLKKTIDYSISNNEVAGVSLLVEKDGQEICFLAEGMADREAGKPITRDTIFRMYSQTKPVCAAAAMILVERGRIDLYQPVSDFLPGFKNQMVWENGKKRPVSRNVRIHDLLQMTSGLYYPNNSCESGREIAELFEKIDKRLLGDYPMTTWEIANAVGQCGLGFDPGSSWNYGTSADVLGAVIEVVSQIPLAEFMKKEIFEPLGMEDTAFWVPQEKRERLAKSYEMKRTEDGNILVPYTGNHLGIQNEMHREPAFASGGAGLVSTLDDYMKFARMLLNLGEIDGGRILRPGTVKHLVGGRLLDHQQKAFEEKMWSTGFSYGNLMRVCINPGQSVMLAREGEYGWGGWLGPHFLNFPNEKLTVLMGMQKKEANTWELTRKVLNIILSCF